ncbi:ATP-binding protein [Terracoccus sp. 273MFTsu3.1]|uniref:sensor histidine kinase n=1 Tax=Terracoccus sp. 273MFTsu3.1 TaxID=1172188 RepID=UPI000366D41B|nr:GAF domain-containing sensor histidine kinase [Terracoccus sp. 273MFTsu3.1]
MTNRTSSADVLDPARRREDALAGYDVLGNAPQRELQALVDIAARVCAVPRAAINLITASHQHQIAATGFDASICAREDSMCAAVLEHTDRVVVPDASLDARFCDNPFVTGVLGTVRFYASAPLTTPDGVIIGRLCVFDSQPRALDEAQEEALVAIAERVVDVLELRLRTRELEDSLAALTETRDELHRSNEALSVFAGQVSHDLRTPLTAIMASTEMLGQQPAVAADEWSERLVATAFRSATRMAGMIEQILAHARVGAELHRSDTDLDAVLSSVLEDLDPTLTARSAALTIGALPTLPADGQQLYSVLLNLVSNAVKYARPGVAPVVEISAVQVGDSWRISVRDNGIGISAADRDRVFGLFSRLETSVDGSGIGLATVKRIIEAHRGTIGISSVDGPGTDVWFELPAQLPRRDEHEGHDGSGAD